MTRYEAPEAEVVSYANSYVLTASIISDHRDFRPGGQIPGEQRPGEQRPGFPGPNNPGRPT